MKQSWPWVRLLHRRHGTSSDVTATWATTDVAAPGASADYPRPPVAIVRQRHRRPALSTTPAAPPANARKTRAYLLAEIACWIVVGACLVLLIVGMT